MPRSLKQLARALRVGLVPLTIATLSASAVIGSSRPATAATASSLKARADQLAREIAATGNQIAALNQRYDGALFAKQQLEAKITADRAAIAGDQRAVTANQQILRVAAVNAYVDNGATTSSTGVFSGSDNAAVSTQVYQDVAAGDLSLAVDNLTNAVGRLKDETANLAAQERQVNAQAAAAGAALAQAHGLVAKQEALLQQTKGALAAAYAAAAAAEEAAAAAAASEVSGGHGFGFDGSQTPITPPPATGHGDALVNAAERYLGVPYVWGGASPSGMDCSGLMVLAFSAIGISIPHYSGAQYDMATPVPTNALQPGDLLFYGPSGSEHVAMYIGGGMMIEAPYTGAVVHNTPVRFGYGFAGAGRI
jgi:peptidoglycan DL-endopeptidase CwlO